MNQKDTKGRSGLQIAADNNLYLMLENSEIGTIVKKMWDGKLSHSGLMESSSLYRNLDDKNSQSDPFKNFKPPLETTVYYHQLFVWMDSCSTRFIPENIITILIIFVYNYWIYLLINTADIMDNILDQENKLKLMVYIYVFLAFSINIETINQYIFNKLSGRRFSLNVWNYAEFLMFGFSLALFYDTTQLSEDGKSDREKDFPFLVRAFILAANEVLVWARITGILLTFVNIGPLIRMTFLMSELLVKYLFIYVLVTVCASTVFTLILYDSSAMYETFTKSMTTCFSGFIQNLNVSGFDKRVNLGRFMLMFYTTLTGILLINLLIALLSNVYQELSRVVEASHRAVLIQYFRIYKWDKNYGFLIFLTSPFNLINFLVLPFTFFSSKEDLPKTNLSICKVYYVLYLIPIVLIYMIYSFVLLPFCFLKGFIIVTKNLFGDISNFGTHLMLFLKWTIFGPLFLLKTILNDLLFLSRTVYRPTFAHENETMRVKKIMREQDVILFLKFINTRPKDEPNDLHTVFLDYLAYEGDFLSKHNSDIMEKKNYFDRINEAGAKNTKLNRSKAKSLLLFSKQDNPSEINSKSMFNLDYMSELETDNNKALRHPDPIKKNLIIIEILENFLIDDGTDNFIIDLDKLKLLLPYTHSINNQYKKRLVFTDMKSVNKALGKLRKKVTQIEQIKQLDKVRFSSFKLNDIIDKEIAHKAKLEQKAEFKIFQKQNLQEAEFENNMLEMTAQVMAEIEIFTAKKEIENRIIKEESAKLKSKQNSISKRILI